MRHHKKPVKLAALLLSLVMIVGGGSNVYATTAGVTETQARESSEAVPEPLAVEEALPSEAAEEPTPVDETGTEPVAEEAVAAGTEGQTEDSSESREA